MLRRITIALIGVWAALCTAATTFAAPAGCNLRVRLEIPVTVLANRVPVTEARINGRVVDLIVDSGAFFSSLTPSTAAWLQLHLRPLPHDTLVIAGGKVQNDKLTSATLTLGGTTFPKESDFLVGGDELGMAIHGLLGQNVLRVADVEYDLADGAVRLIKPEGDCRTMMPTYWAKPGDAYSVMDIEWATPAEPHTVGYVFLNGAKIKVMFDTASPISILSLRAAEKAGFKPDIPGATSAGSARGASKTWIAPFQSFKIGNEEIRNTRLRVGNADLPEGDMLIGADFFLSHRIYVSSKEQKLYFTYNGGPIFNLTTRPESGLTANRNTDPAETPVQNSQSPPGNGAPPAGSEAKPTPDNLGTGADPLPGSQSDDDPAFSDSVASAGAADTMIPGGQPTTADEFFRRGAAYLARRDYAPALTDIQRACEMNPQEPKYFLERATVYWHSGRLDQSDADIETTLKLKPGYLEPLIWRARRELTKHDTVAAIADLDAADRVAPPQENARFTMGRLYQRAEALPQAIRQFGLWIDAHKQDAGLPGAYTARCWVRALSGQELDQAITDCDLTLHRVRNEPSTLATRGLVYLRLSQFSSAISDYDAALKQRPKNAWALYGRGLAESRLNKTAAAETDFKAATAINSDIAADFKKRGITP